MTIYSTIDYLSGSNHWWLLEIVWVWRVVQLQPGKNYEQTFLRNINYHVDLTNSRVYNVTSTNFPSITLWNDSERESIQEGNSLVFVMFITILSQLNINSLGQLDSTNVVIEIVSLFHFHPFILSNHLTRRSLLLW
jgi:hypothetical protein